MMEDDEMNQIAQQNARIRDRFLASARQYLLAADATQDAQRSADGDGKHAAQALTHACGRPQNH
ncbi:MAG: hypothetical protein C0489_08855 [Candidatus Accumulibacter sp.]|nr:hypothetical protein [Accumulibacter sp.]MBA4094183.1 hypothetical protein [Accumulibacter sp.]